ncbi:MAG: hypothetical protein ACE5I1_03360 [bacterium]
MQTMTLENLPNEKERAKIGKKARRIYAKIRKELEKDHWGKFIAINVDNGDYIVSSEHGVAAEQLIKKYPELIPYIIRIGYEAVYHFGGSGIRDGLKK